VFEGIGFLTDVVLVAGLFLGYCLLVVLECDWEIVDIFPELGVVDVIWVKTSNLLDLELLWT
jgi:hypothetical protein